MVRWPVAGGLFPGEKTLSEAHPRNVVLASNLRFSSGTSNVVLGSARSGIGLEPVDPKLADLQAYAITNKTAVPWILPVAGVWREASQTSPASDKTSQTRWLRTRQM